MEYAYQDMNTHYGDVKATIDRYDSVTARFITEDDSQYTKSNDPLSLNLYTYCHNEPIIYIDLSGHWGEKVHLTETEV